MCIADKQYRILRRRQKLDQIHTAATVDEHEDVAVVLVAIEGSLEVLHAHPTINKINISSPAPPQHSTAILTLEQM